jgi:TolB-like protein
MDESLPSTPLPERAPDDRLHSWKEIAVYLDRDVTTVQRWEKREAMPVHRHVHDKRSSVYAWTHELDAWQQSRGPRVEEADEDANAARSHAVTRLMVLPFRVLRHNEASDFLAVALPDAVASSLCGIDSVITRSTLMASRFANSTSLDLKRVAEEAQVDRILTGTILSDGQHIRVSTQLVEAATGTMIWTNTSEISSTDVFALQDQLVDRIVESLRLPLTAREHRLLKHDVPANAVAYGHYLRANAVAQNDQYMVRARDLYVQCLEADPRYAPAWARLGRAYRFIGKYVGEEAKNIARAEEAFQKSFSLNPDLALAHNLYTSLEADLGRALNAMRRLLRRAQTNRNDPDLFAGLVQACRYCGLLDASIAAHERARQLDPYVRTSVSYTYRYLEDIQAALDHSVSEHEYLTHLVWAPTGREVEVLTRLREREKATPAGRLGAAFLTLCRTYLEGDRTKALHAVEQCLQTEFRDPEALFGLGLFFAKLNEPRRALETISQALNGGYFCHHMLLHHSWFASFRSCDGFSDLARDAAERSAEARDVFLENVGDRILRLPTDPARPTAAS